MLWPSRKKMTARKTTTRNSLVPNEGGFGSRGSAGFRELGMPTTSINSNVAWRGKPAQTQPYACTRFALLHCFSPLHCPPLVAALVRQHHRPHGSQSLLRSDVERRFLLDRVAHVCVEPAIISAFGFYFHAGLAHQAQRAPQFFRFHSPIRAPIQSIRAIFRAQPRLLRIHSVLHKRSLGAVKQEMRAWSIREDACPPH